MSREDLGSCGSGCAPRFVMSLAILEFKAEMEEHVRLLAERYRRQGMNRKPPCWRRGGSSATPRCCRRTGGPCGRYAAIEVIARRSDLRRPHAAQEPGVRSGGGGNAGARYWREYGDFQRMQCSALQAAALCGAGPHRDALGTDARRKAEHSGSGELRRLAQREPVVQRHGGGELVQFHPWRTRRGGPVVGSGRFVEFLFAVGSAVHAGPQFSSGGGPARAEPGSDSQPPGLAGTVRRRQGYFGKADHAERQQLYGGRRAAGEFSIRE